jgi:hypothetical protein
MQIGDNGFPTPIIETITVAAAEATGDANENDKVGANNKMAHQVFQQHTTTWTVQYPITTLHRVTLTHSSAVVAATIPIAVNYYDEDAIRKRDVEERLVNTQTAFA